MGKLLLFITLILLNLSNLYAQCPVANAGTDQTLTCTNLGPAVVGMPASGGYTYLWSPNTGIFGSVTSSQINVGPTTTTTYTLTVTETATGCIDSDDVTITVEKSLPTADAGDDVQVDCTNSSQILGGTANSGYTYSWNPSTGLDDSTAANPVASPTSTTTYEVLVTDNVSGCTDRDTVTVTYDTTKPTANAGSDDSVNCSTVSVPIGSTPVTGYSYSWSPTTGLSDPSSANPTAFPTTTTVYSLTVTNDATGCEDVDTVTITAGAVFPLVDAGTDQQIDCDNDVPVTIGMGPLPNHTYSWIPSTGLSNPISSIPTAYPTSTTIYTLTVTNTLTGCSSMDTVEITVDKDPPVADAGVNITIDCNTPSLQIGATDVTDYEYSWSPITGLSDDDIADPIANPSTDTLYMLTVTDTTNGCTSTDTVYVTVNKDAPIAYAGADGAVNCVTTEHNLGAATISGYEYSWSPTTDLNDATISNPIASPSTSTVYTLTVTETATGCTATDTVTVTNTESYPTADAGTDDTINCYTSSINIGMSAEPGIDYVWTPTTDLSSSTISNPTASPTTTTTYTLTATNPTTGCVISDSITITVDLVDPTVDAGGDNTITCNYPEHILGPTITNTDYSYSWSPATGLDSTTIANPTASPTTDTTYTLTITDTTNGCTETDTVTVYTNIAEPATPTAVDYEECETIGGTTLYFNNQIIPTSGVDYYWYSTRTGSTLLTDQNPLVDNDIATTEGQVASYWLGATDTVNGCESADRTLVTLEIFTVPNNPIAIDGSFNYSYTECEDTTLQTLSYNDYIVPITGFDYEWYDQLSGGTFVGTDPTLNITTGPVTYYVEAVDPSSLCTSELRTPITLEISPAPSAATLSGTTSGSLVEECQTDFGVTQTLDANNYVITSTANTYTWYDAPIAGNVVASPTLNTTGSVSYYVEVTDINTSCSSLTRTEVELSILFTPQTPVSTLTGGTAVASCGTGATALDANNYVTLPTGINHIWYDAASGGNVITSPTLSTPGAIETYYVEAESQVSLCTSTARTAITLSINDIPTAPTLAPEYAANNGIIECQSSDPPQTLDALEAIEDLGLTYTWYTTETPSTGSVVTDPTLSTVGNTTYYVTATNSAGCESLTRTPVYLEIEAAPAKPTYILGTDGVIDSATGYLSVTQCQITDPIQVLDARDYVYEVPGTVIEWYDDIDPTVGHLVTDPILDVATSITYYAQAVSTTTLGSCTSLERSPVTLTIDAAPDQPVTLYAGGVLEVCEGDLTELDGNTVIEIEPDTTYTWYDDPVAGSVVTSPTIDYFTTQQFYVSATTTSTGCESLERTEVTLTLFQNPGVPFPDGIFEFCTLDLDRDIDPILTVSATPNQPGSEIIRWYWDPSHVGDETLVRNTGNEYTPTDPADGRIYPGIEDPGLKSFYVTGYNTVNNCESDPIEVQLYIYRTPDFILNDIFGDGNSYPFTIEDLNVYKLTPFEYTDPAIDGFFETVHYDLLNEDTGTRVEIADDGTFRINISGNYTLTARNYFNYCGLLTTNCESHTCPRSTSFYIDKIDIELPNVMIPNGSNPELTTWYPLNLQAVGELSTVQYNAYKNMEVQIFDRYGRLLDTLSGYLNSAEGKGWNGIYNGELLPTGDYWYHISLNDEANTTYTGSFTLYRL